MKTLSRVTCKRIPLVFQKELYAGVSFASAVLYVAPCYGKNVTQYAKAAHRKEK
jgi:uncharacterized membrane protein YeiH